MHNQINWKPLDTLISVQLSDADRQQEQTAIRLVFKDIVELGGNYPTQGKNKLNSLLFMMIFNSNIKQYVSRYYEDRPIGENYLQPDAFQLLPLGKAELRRNFTKRFGIILPGAFVRAALERLVFAKLLVPVDNFYLINLPYICRALTAYKYEVDHVT